jgi:hydrogenase nickel incorporation protein HypB
MCTTCGCGTGAKATVEVLDHGERAHAERGAHVHEHGDHDHGHGAHSHEHGNHEHSGHARAVAQVDAGPSPRTLVLEREVLAKNDQLAARNRAFFAGREVVALNLMSSPGAGKTTLLEKTIRQLGGELALSVIEGDQETVRDAERIRAAGCKAVQINTGAGCHLDADMVAKGVRALDPRPRSLLFIENVGNLVCPALFDLGERAKVVIASVTEGEDKPLKYPHIFRACEVLLLNKIDLLPHLEFDADLCIANALRVNPALRVFRLSATRGDGLDEWCGWLREQLQRRS